MGPSSMSLVCLSFTFAAAIHGFCFSICCFHFSLSPPFSFSPIHVHGQAFVTCRIRVCSRSSYSRSSLLSYDMDSRQLVFCSVSLVSVSVEFGPGRVCCFPVFIFFKCTLIICPRNHMATWPLLIPAVYLALHDVQGLDATSRVLLIDLFRLCCGFGFTTSSMFCRGGSLLAV